jgi:site-specific DNA-methyltransferase (adenine-specific)
MASDLSIRVIAGDCLQILPQLEAASVDLILTDPPYAIHYRSNRRVTRPKFNHLTGDQPGRWMEDFARESFRLLKPNRHLYCFCRFDTYPRFFEAFRQAGFTVKRTLIWVKNNHGSGDLKGD